MSEPEQAPRAETPNAHRFLRVPEAAAIARVSCDWIRGRVRFGALPAVRTAPGRGGRILVTEAAVLALLRRNGRAG
ncbi:MAG: helix-turn-helix domain-containing protein [Planctomycetes bacterium]|nr:helix-turn-helix domain-containing protein [Planctomycetota bacterium]